VRGMAPGSARWLHRTTINANEHLSMTTQTAILATLIVILGAAQYALCFQALRDLVHRPRVRGDNKVLWGLGILCIPIAGALVYNWMGPTSFIRRPIAPDYRESGPGMRALQPLGDNVTPITAARAGRRRRVTAIESASRARVSRRSPIPISRVDRTGS
jgi:hypothetical protein